MEEKGGEGRGKRKIEGERNGGEERKNEVKGKVD